MGSINTKEKLEVVLNKSLKQVGFFLIKFVHICLYNNLSLSSDTLRKFYSFLLLQLIIVSTYFL